MHNCPLPATQSVGTRAQAIVCRRRADCAAHDRLSARSAATHLRSGTQIRFTVGIDEVDVHLRAFLLRRHGGPFAQNGNWWGLAISISISITITISITISITRPAAISPAPIPGSALLLPSAHGTSAWCTPAKPASHVKCKLQTTS